MDLEKHRESIVCLFVVGTSYAAYAGDAEHVSSADAATTATATDAAGAAATATTSDDAATSQGNAQHGQQHQHRHEGSTEDCSFTATAAAAATAATATVAEQEGIVVRRQGPLKREANRLKQATSDSYVSLSVFSELNKL